MAQQVLLVVTILREAGVKFVATGFDWVVSPIGEPYARRPVISLLDEQPLARITTSIGKSAKPNKTLKHHRCFKIHADGVVYYDPYGTIGNNIPVYFCDPEFDKKVVSLVRLVSI